MKLAAVLAFIFVVVVGILVGVFSTPGRDRPRTALRLMTEEILARSSPATPDEAARIGSLLRRTGAATRMKLPMGADPAAHGLYYLYARGRWHKKDDRARVHMRKLLEDHGFFAVFHGSSHRVIEEAHRFLASEEDRAYLLHQLRRWHGREKDRRRKEILASHLARYGSDDGDEQRLQNEGRSIGSNMSTTR